MGGMLPVAAIAFANTPGAHAPTEPLFWFRLSLALMTGALVAYPINSWMVAHHLKHGMMTVRPAEAGTAGGMKMEMDMSDGGASHAPQPPVWVMTVISLVVLAIGTTIAFTFGSGH